MTHVAASHRAHYQHGCTRPRLGTSPRHREGQRLTTVPVMARRERRRYVLLVVAWLVLNVRLWTWWLSPSHAGNMILFSVVSVALVYNVCLLPSIYLGCLGFMRRPLPVGVRRAE